MISKFGNILVLFMVRFWEGSGLKPCFRYTTFWKFKTPLFCVFSGESIMRGVFVLRLFSTRTPYTLSLTLFVTRKTLFFIFYVYSHTNITNTQLTWSVDPINRWIINIKNSVKSHQTRSAKVNNSSWQWHAAGAACEFHGTTS